MPIVDVLRSATSVDARVLHMSDKIGQVKAGLLGRCDRSRWQILN